MHKNSKKTFQKFLQPIFFGTWNICEKKLFSDYTVIDFTLGGKIDFLYNKSLVVQGLYSISRRYFWEIVS